MKTWLSIITIPVILLLGLALGFSQEIIHEGAWTIKNPVLYGFPAKAAAPYKFIPTLTVGSNGTMLSVQISGGKTGAPPLVGQDFTVAVKSGNTTLKQLYAPQGNILRIAGMPVAIWYFAPPPGQPISELVLSFRGTPLSWPFSLAKKMQP